MRKGSFLYDGSFISIESHILNQHIDVLNERGFFDNFNQSVRVNRVIAFFNIQSEVD